MNSSSNNPLVTIITIVFNNVTTIRNAIQSVAYQDYDNIEHIVIDNCSTDGTIEAVNGQDPNISVGRTGYTEDELYDFKADNTKFSSSLQYKLNLL